MSTRNGHSDPQAPLEPRNRSEAEDEIAGKPLTLGYRPRGQGAYAYGEDEGRFDYWRVLNCVEGMLAHPDVDQPYGYYKAGISSVKFGVKARNKTEEKEARDILKRAWETCLDDLQLVYDYGWSAYEPTFRRSKGLLLWEGLLPIHPLDATALIRNGAFVGASVQGSMSADPRIRSGEHYRQGGGIKLRAAGRYPGKVLWLTHRRRWNRFYGRSQLTGAWRPWLRLTGRDMGEEIVDGAIHRRGYAGPIVYYPSRDYKRADGGIDYEAARGDARQMSEQSKAGFSAALPSDRDAQGNRYWEIEWPDTSLANLSGLLEYEDGLQKQISRGIGVPPELIEAGETGSGWSGRKVPLLGFYQAQLANARRMVRALVNQLVEPLLRWNHGPQAWCEVEVELDLPAAVSGEQPQQQQPAPEEQPAEEAQPAGQPQPEAQPTAGGLESLLPAGGAEMALPVVVATVEPSTGTIIAPVRADDADLRDAAYLLCRRVLRESREGVALSAEWDEGKHARDHGKFAHTQGRSGEAPGESHSARHQRRKDAHDSQSADLFIGLDEKPQHVGTPEASALHAARVAAHVAERVAAFHDRYSAAADDLEARGAPPAAVAKLRDVTAKGKAVIDKAGAKATAATAKLHVAAEKLRQAPSPGPRPAEPLLADDADEVAEAAHEKTYAAFEKAHAAWEKKQDKHETASERFHDAKEGLESSSSSLRDAEDDWEEKAETAEGPALAAVEEAEEERRAREGVEMARASHGAGDFAWRALEGGGKNNWVRRVKGHLQYSVDDPRPSLKTPPPLPASAQKKTGPPPLPAKAAAAPTNPAAAPPKKGPPPLPGKAPAAPPAKTAPAKAPTAPAPAPVKAPEPPGKAAIDPSLHPEGQAFMKQAAANIRGHATLPMEKRKEYYRATEQVMRSMSPAAAARVAAHLPKGIEYAADTTEVKRLAVETCKGANKDRVAKSPEIGGFYTRGRLVVDGAYSEKTRASFAKSEKLRTGTTVGLHAHEMAHAIDGPAQELSSSPEWQAAFAEEIAKGKLTKYATTKTSEGWAEFGRLILAGEHDVAKVKAAFPKCTAVWERMGLIPKAGVALSADDGEIHLPEMFAGRVEMDDEGGHGDILLSSETQPVEMGWTADDEKKHPRDHGRFAENPGGGAAVAEEAFVPTIDLEIEDRDEVEKAWAFLIGDDFDLDDVGDLVGAQDGSTVTVSCPGSRQIEIAVSHPDYSATRRIVHDERLGGCYVKNDIFMLDDRSKRGGGLGAKVIAAQVEACRRAGIKALRCHAAGSIATNLKEGFNGYITWPKFGYDMPLEELPGLLRTAAGKAVPGAESVLDVMDAPEAFLTAKEFATAKKHLADLDAKLGRPARERTKITGEEWWTAFGWDMEDAELDLRDGSRSLEVFEAYMAKKKAAGKSLAREDEGNVHPAEPRKPAEEPDFSAEDEAIMDAVWEERRRKAAEAKE